MNTEPGAGAMPCGGIQPQRTEAQGASFTVRLATADDIDALTELHWSCFEPDDHLAVLLGKPYVKAMYRWQVSGKEACTMIVESNGEAMGFGGVCDGPYRWPMFKACLGQFLISLARSPRLLVDSRLWRRLFDSQKQLDRQTRRILSRPGVAHLTVGAVDARLRQRGIHVAYLEALLAITKARGGRAVCVGMRRSNGAAHGAFVKLGWSEVPVSEGSEMVYYITDLDTDCACSE